MRDPSFVRRYGQASRPRAHLRILEEGELGAGDAVDVDVARLPDHCVTVRLISDAILLDHRLIPQVLEVPQLLPELREWITRGAHSHVAAALNRTHCDRTVAAMCRTSDNAFARHPPIDGYGQSPPRRPDFWIVADTGLVAALPLSLSARPKRKSDRRRHEDRRAWSFVNAAISNISGPHCSV